MYGWEGCGETTDQARRTLFTNNRYLPAPCANDFHQKNPIYSKTILLHIPELPHDVPGLQFSTANHHLYGRTDLSAVSELLHVGADRSVRTRYGVQASHIHRLSTWFNRRNLVSQIFIFRNRFSRFLLVPRLQPVVNRNIVPQPTLRTCLQTLSDDPN